MDSSKNRKQVCEQIVHLAKRQYQELQKIISNVKEHVCDAQVAMQATYDTTRQEQSWLHDGLNLRLDEISDIIEIMESASSSDRSKIGTVFNIEIDGILQQLVLVPVGFTIDLASLNFSAVSLGSPMGKALLEVTEPNTTIDYYSPDGKKQKLIIKEIYK